MSLSGKVICITGAASGMGAATARLCAEKGAILSLADINADSLESVAKGLGGSHLTAVVDVRDSKAVDAWIKQTVEKYGRIDAATNFAGISGMLKPLIELSDEDWDAVHQINLRGTFFCNRAQLRVMKEGASIVNIASVAGIRGAARLGSYVAAKHGVVGLTKTAAMEAGPQNIRVNAICPGIIQTPMLQDVMAPGQPLEFFTERAPLAIRRAGTPEEVAKMAIFLMSDDSSYSTGSCFVIDAGLTAT